MKNDGIGSGHRGNRQDASSVADDVALNLDSATLDVSQSLGRKGGFYIRIPIVTICILLSYRKIDLSVRECLFRSTNSHSCNNQGIHQSLKDYRYEVL
jgi:hypothetical protein